MQDLKELEWSDRWDQRWDLQVETLTTMFMNSKDLLNKQAASVFWWKRCAQSQTTRRLSLVRLLTVKGRQTKFFDELDQKLAKKSSSSKLTSLKDRYSPCQRRSVMETSTGNYGPQSADWHLLLPWDFQVYEGTGDRDRLLSNFTALNTPKDHPARIWWYLLSASEFLLCTSRHPGQDSSCNGSQRNSDQLFPGKCSIPFWMMTLLIH